MDARCHAPWLRWCATALLVSAIAGQIPDAAAQPAGTAAAAESVSRWTSNQRSFQIPFELGEGDTTSVVELYYSYNGQEWKLHQRSKPGGGKFSFQAQADGAYWFTSRTIDAQGRPHPTGPLQPQLLVIVDATAPQVDLKLTSDANGNIQSSWTIEDPGLAAKTLSLAYQLDGQWKPVTVQLPPQQTQAGVTKLRGGVTWRPEVPLEATQVRLTIADAAGNEAKVTESVEIRPEQLAAQTKPPAGPTVPPEQAPSPRNDQAPATPTAQPQPPRSATEEIAASPYSRPAQRGAAESVPRPSASVTRPASQMTDNARGGTYRLPAPAESTAGRRDVTNQHVPVTPSPTSPASDAETGGPARSAAGGAVAATAGAKPWYADFQAQQRQKIATQETARPSTPNRDVTTPVAGPVAPPVARRAAENSSNEAIEWADLAVESTNASSFQLDYDLESVGPEGVAKVVLWVTRDKGAQWIPYTEDADRTSPVDVEVNEEGLYGFRVQVTGNNGLGAQPPKSGEQADIWIHVDRTPPAAELKNVPYGRGPTAGKLEIYWTAEDARLASRPVTLRYSESPGGPWTTIAASLPNDGKFVWGIEPNTPEEVYLRLEVTDRAGNVGVDQLADPVRLQPLIPKARIRGFKPVSRVSLGTDTQTALLR